VSNPFLTLQNTLKTYLGTISGMTACPILTEDPGDPLNTAYLALFRGALPANAAGQTGLACVISLWSGQTADADLRVMLPMMRMIIRISVFENVPVNRDPAGGTQQGGLETTWTIINSLHGYSVGIGQAPITFVRFDTDSSPTEPILAWYVDFELTTALT
jgi:hypothetical protein